MNRRHSGPFAGSIALAAAAAHVLSSPAVAQSIEPLGLLPGASEHHITGISGDGAIIVGHAMTPAGRRAFRWSEASGTVELPMLAGWTSAYALAISSDGLTIVGQGGSETARRAALWMSGPAGFTVEDLGTSPGGTEASATGVSADGGIVVGWGANFLATRWTRATGMVVLDPGFTVARGVSADGEIVFGSAGYCQMFWSAASGLVHLPPCWSHHDSHFATAISDDGSTIVGYSDGLLGTNAAARWHINPNPAEATYLYPPSGTGYAAAYAVNADGSIIAGSGAGMALVWHGSTIASSLRELLNRSGVGLSNWHLQSALALSDDGRTIAGTGVHNGAEQLWIATLPHRAFCYANCDNSTMPPVLNVDDFTCFINEFALATTLPHQQQVEHYANCDRGYIAPPLNVDDFTCFINSFAMGCP